MGADLDVHAPTIESVVGYAPAVTRVEPQETADVHRIWLSMPTSKTQLVTEYGIRTDLTLDALRIAARDARDWLGHSIDRALVVTHQPVIAAISSTIEGRLTLATIGADTAYYGALRGLDRWADCQLVITIGDPRPNIGEIERQARVAPMPTPDQLAACELEQAHGRLRTIHRAGRLVIVHVGYVRPRGHAWASVEPRKVAPK
jgi:hypothetical protein